MIRRSTTISRARAAIESLEPRFVLSGICFTDGSDESAHFRGFVFNDLNANGVHDSGEPPLRNRTVIVGYDDFSSFYYEHETQLASDAQGMVDFAYNVCGEVHPQSMKLKHKYGWRQTVQEKNEVINGKTVRLLPATQLALVGGNLFNDLDANGAQDSNEPLVPGWRVFLDSNQNSRPDSGERSVVTDQTGRWSFPDLPAGTYAFHVQSQTGVGQSLPAPDDDLHVTVGNGEVNNGLQLAIRAASVNGLVFNDLDGNRLPGPAEAPLAGWRVYADENRDGKWQSSEESALSDGDGKWTLNLAPGNHLIRVEDRDPWPQTGGAAGYDLALKRGKSVTGVPFGLRGVAISGSVFHDSNGDKIWSSGETALGGWSVYLDQNENRKFDSGERTAGADVSGNWSFSDLPPGHYVVRGFSSSEFARTTPSGGAGAYVVDLSPGQISRGNMFAFGRLTRITGLVGNDMDEDGLYTYRDLPASGWSVYLDQNNDGRLDGTERFTTTSLVGQFSFPNLAPGLYHVRVAPKDGWQRVGSSDLEMLATDDQKRLTREVSFLYHASSISGTIYEDVNVNRKRDPGEHGSGGIYIDLNNNGSNEYGEPVAYFDDKGNWTIGGLLPGRYVVKRPFSDDVYSVIPSSGYRIIDVGEFEHKNGVVFSYARNASVSGVVFNDRNRDGTRQSDEPGIGTWTIYEDLNNNGTRDPDEPFDISETGFRPYVGLFALSVRPGHVILRADTTGTWTGSKPADATIVLDLLSDQRVEDLSFAMKKVG